ADAGVYPTARPAAVVLSNSGPRVVTPCIYEGSREGAISMDGRGAWRDNVFVERLWRSVKYEEVYLRAYGSVGDARASLSRYFTFYNTKRPHSSLDGRTPERFY